jgi:hypothetical protein
MIAVISRALGGNAQESTSSLSSGRKQVSWYDQEAENEVQMEMVRLGRLG